ncbi:tyrosine-type recombinase/integrase [Kribbella deserti]|uniref:Tyrosine-type recombinase/integrase n=1 Tax=Kribbella deserti TaxID=1926257 RepID=A0ABV6QS10_9ACTN
MGKPTAHRNAQGSGMAHVKDQWTRPVKYPAGVVERERTARWGRGKRWLAAWLDPEGNEKTKAFASKTEASRYAAAMETDRSRGDYLDPSLGKVKLGEFIDSWLASRMTDPSSKIRYESLARLHVAPPFGHRQVQGIKPSEIAKWVAPLVEQFGPSTARGAFMVLNGALGLAAADGNVKKNPAQDRVVKRPPTKPGRVAAWSDEMLARVIKAHPTPYRPLPIIAAGCGLRQSEVFGLALEDIDLETQMVHIRRQVKKLGRDFVFTLPKNDTEREVPLDETTAEVILEHLAAFGARPYTLPWEDLDGPPLTVQLLFRWTDDKHIRARTYNEMIWKPALAASAIIPQPTTDARGRRHYGTDRENGFHALRHYYASVTLADGVNIKDLAEFLGHSDSAFTLRQYTHMLPSSHDRARSAVGKRLGKIIDASRSRDGAELPYRRPLELPGPLGQSSDGPQISL